MHVVLIQPAEPFGRNAIIPQSLLELAAALREASIGVEIIDARLNDLTVHQTIDLLGRKQFDLVGITGLNNAYRYIKDFSFEYKRAFPGKPLMAGGHFIMTIPEAILRRVPIDVACTGEGDQIIAELSTRLVEKTPLEGLPNIAYLDHGEVRRTPLKPVENLDAIPLPAFDLLDMRRYVESAAKLGGFHLTTGRGCVYHCYYCGSAYHKVRKLSPARLIRILDMLHADHGVDSFVFSEENAFYPPGWLIEVCDRLNDLGRTYRLAVAGCADHVTAELCTALASLKGGATASIAVEHWNPDIQTKFHRHKQGQAIDGALELLHRHRIPNRGISILWGHPDDTTESFKETLCRSLAIQRRYSIRVVSVRALLAIPNSGFWKDALQRGKIRDVENFMYSTTGYAPFVNLSRYDDDTYRKGIAELGIWKAYFNAAGAGRLKYRVARVVLNALTALPVRWRRPFRGILERIFMVPLYDPAADYYRRLACFAEIVALPAGSRLVACGPASRDDLSRLFNSVREAKALLVGFLSADWPEESHRGGVPALSVEQIPALKPTHIAVLPGGQFPKSERMRAATGNLEVVTIKAAPRGRQVPGKGLDMWISLEESARFSDKCRCRP